MQGPRRIVALTEETTEWLYLLGEESRLVGISAYTVRPERAKKEKPVVSAFISGSVSKIKALKPDLVIGFSDIQSKLAAELIAEGLQVMIFNQRSLEEIFEALTWMCDWVHQGAKGRDLIAGYRSCLDQIRADSKKDPFRPRVFFQEWDEPLISGIQWVSELVQIAGGDDIFLDRYARSNQSLAKDRIMTLESVAQKNPQIIIGSWCGKPVNFEWIRNQVAWAHTDALKHNRLTEIDSSIILQPGPALFLEGVQAIRRSIETCFDGTSL